jgi:chromosome segregation ATPase
MFGKKKRIIQTQAKNMERYRAEMEDMRQKNAVLQDLVDAVKKDNKRLTWQEKILTENLDKTEAAFRMATDEIERLRDEIQRRRRLYQAGTNKLRGNLGEMGRAFGQLQYQNTVLQANLNTMTETAAQYEQDVIAVTADNRELQARLLCYQGVEKLLFTAAAESAPAAEQEDSGKEADEEMQPPPNLTKPAKLLTVGSLVRWKKDTMNDVVYEIERFHVDEDGQTLANINIVNGTIGFTVPVEELEAVEE